uniref:Ubiquitin-protein ligase n=1 Tax=Pithovirus LCDPAC02 TaxID=2506601 RepID=A0A481YQ62_9VIRU|nr:MAG: ubiquitin-protein ligase [Pithovirus LCDPAC02]
MISNYYYNNILNNYKIDVDYNNIDVDYYNIDVDYFMNITNKYTINSTDNINVEFFIKYKKRKDEEIVKYVYEEIIKYKKRKDEEIMKYKKLKDEEIMKNEGNVCCICLDDIRNVVILPCKHMCICKKCSKLDIEKCPLCRQNIKKYMEVYV